MSPAKTQPALLGGVVIGVLSALPVISVANVCCCAWIVFGGALAAYLMQANHPEPVQIGDGAVVGLLAGLAGAFVWLIVFVPLSAMMAPFESRMAQRAMENAEALPPEIRALLEGFSGGPSIGIGLLFMFFVMLVVGTTFGMFGGLFGALLFRKSTPVVPPPIPQ
ncbi:MAG TPA: DUF5518 domain-containing protein [Vicinamibacterales bacterium]|jgi:ABC-type phosphate transport system permease subunit